MHFFQKSQRIRISDGSQVSGWALGYIGGGLLLAINLGHVEISGMAWISHRDISRFRTVFSRWLLVADLFTSYISAFKREGHGKNSLPLKEVIFDAGLSDVFSIPFAESRSFRELTKFLLAFLIYNDGIETVIVMASIFGAEVLGMKTNELILFFLMIQGIAFVGSMIFGFLADAIGNKRTVMISLGIWSLIVLWAFQLGIVWDPKTEYWILGVLVAIVLGGSQAASRSLQGLFTPDANSAEFFGFFAVSGKFASIFGPLIYGILIAITGSVQSGVLSVLVFFVVGMAILWTVNEKKGMEEKQKPVR